MNRTAVQILQIRAEHLVPQDVINLAGVPAFEPTVHYRDPNDTVVKAWQAIPPEHRSTIEPGHIQWRSDPTSGWQRILAGPFFNQLDTGEEDTDLLRESLGPHFVLLRLACDSANVASKVHAGDRVVHLAVHENAIVAVQHVVTPREGT